MRNDEQITPGATDMLNVSSSDFFGLATSEANDRCTSSFRSPVNDRCSKPTSRYADAPSSPNASLNFRFIADCPRPVFSPRWGPKTTLSVSRRSTTTLSAPDVDGVTTTTVHGDDGISTSNAMDRNRNVERSRRFSPPFAVPLTTVVDGMFSQLWACDNMQETSWLNSGSPMAPAVQQQRQPLRRPSSADLDDAVWGVLRGHIATTPAADSLVRSEDRGGAISIPHSPRELPSLSAFSPMVAPQLPRLVSTFTAPATSPLPSMSLARPSTSAAVSLALYDIGAGTSSAGDNRFSMVLGVDSPHPRDVLRPPPPRLPSCSYLRFVPPVEQSFLPDAAWECSVSEVNYDRSSGARSPCTSRNPSQGASPRASHLWRRCSLLGDNDDVNCVVGSVTPVDALLNYQYFDSVLPLMLQCGDAMRRVKQQQQYRSSLSQACFPHHGLLSISDAANPQPIEGCNEVNSHLATCAAYPTQSMPNDATTVTVDVVQIHSPLSSTDSDSASSAMREVEEIMAALGIVPQLSNIESCDDENGSVNEEAPHAPQLPTALLSCVKANTTAEVALKAIHASGRATMRVASASSHNVALPRLSSKVRTSMRCHAVTAISTPAASPPMRAAPSALVHPAEKPSVTHDAASPEKLAAVVRQPSLPVIAPSPPTQRQLPRNPCGTPLPHLGLAGDADTISATSSRQQQSESPQTISEMLRARAVRTNHVTPHILLVQNDSSGLDTSLSKQQQRSPWTPQLFSNGRLRSGAATAPALDRLSGWRKVTEVGSTRVSVASSQSADVSTPLEVAEVDWAATERISFAAATECTTSRTVPAMAHLVARGCNVFLASLHARCSQPTAFTAWGTLLPEFFNAFFQCLQDEKSGPSSAHVALLSVALLKCDLYRDALSDVVRFNPLSLLGTPLLGARLGGLHAVPVTMAADCLRVLTSAHERLSSDDHLNGSLVVTLTLKQQERSATTGVLRDVVLSSFTAFATNAEVYADVLQAERLPATAGFLLQLFRGPVQAAVSVYTRYLHQTPAELRRAVEVHRVLRSRVTLPPRVGSVVRLLEHIRRELRVFWTVLEASKKRVVERAAAAAAGVAVREDAAEVAVYAREKAQRAQLRHALRALSCLSTDCTAVLSDPVSKLPPLYVLSPRTTGSCGADQHPQLPHRGTTTTAIPGRAPSMSRYAASVARRYGDGTEEPRRAGGEAWETASEGSEEAAAAGGGSSPPQVKNGRPAAKTATTTTSTTNVSGGAAAAAVLRWDSAVPLPNLFAGDVACGWRGIRPLFRLKDPLLREAFQTVGPPAESATMQSVVYLETQEIGRSATSPPGGDVEAAAAAAAADSTVGDHHHHDDGDAVRRATLLPGTARNGVVGFTVNGVLVGAPRALSGMPKFEVGELCVRGSSAGGGCCCDGGENTSCSATIPPDSGVTTGCASGVFGAPFSAAPLRAGAFTSSISGASAMIRAAFRGFLEGQNISVLSVTESSAEVDAVTRMLRSPLWPAMRELVEAALHGADAINSTAASLSSAPLARQELLMSITQPLSIDCVKDHLRGDPAAQKEAGVGVCADCFLCPAGAEEVMAFQSAWTPAGPVVAGARYIPITSVGQFHKITRELPAHVRAVAEARRTESLGGTHVLVSFVLRQRRAPCASLVGSLPRIPARSVETTTRTSPTAGSAAQVFFTSATVLLSTESMFWNALWLDDHVSPSHPLNILRPTYCHRVVNVVDVAASAAGRAWPLLLTQERMTERRKLTLWQAPWSMQAYAAYLIRHRDVLRWCMTRLITTNTTVRTPGTAEGDALQLRCRPHMDLQRTDLPAELRGLFYGERVWLTDLAAVLRQVELMYAVAADLVEGRELRRGAWTEQQSPGGRPLALLDRDVVYDLTAPPTIVVRTPLDPLPGTAEQANPLAVEKPTPSPPSVQRLESDAHPLLHTLRTGQARTTVSPRGVKATAAAPRRGVVVAEEPSEVALRRFVLKHGVSRARRSRNRKANAAPAAPAASAIPAPP